MRDTEDVPQASRIQNTILAQYLLCSEKYAWSQEVFIYLASTFIIMQLINQERQEQLQRKV